MKKTFLVAFLLLLHLPCFSQQAAPPKAYLSGWNSLQLDTVQYRLAFSAHPSAVYYKQEYLPAEDSFPHFHRMLLAELALGTASAASLVQDKMAELERLKKSNPVVHYVSYQKDGEYILDFLLSVNTTDGKVSLVERNVYRYVPVTTTSGKKAVLLVGASQRAYGDAVTAFFERLKEDRMSLANQIGALKIPPVTLE